MSAADTHDSPPNESPETQQRIESLELNVMELEQTIATLDSIVARLNSELATVHDACCLMERRLAILSVENGPADDATEVPPHY